MQIKTFELNIETIDGDIQLSPVCKTFSCKDVSPMGLSVVRGYNNENCIIAKSVFLFRQGQMVFGTTEFKDTQGFYDYINSHCH